MTSEPRYSMDRRIWKGGPMVQYGLNSVDVQPVQTDLGGHHQTRRAWIDRHISGHETNISEFCLHLSVLLVGKCLQWEPSVLSTTRLVLNPTWKYTTSSHFDRACIDNSLLLVQTGGNGVFCDHCLSSTGMG